MTTGDELVVALEELPDNADIGTLFHLRLTRESGEHLTCALLVREMGPVEALCEVLAIQPAEPEGPTS
ncbi:hypothetical protein [Kushneria indalinina]|uniref:Uncharacterized protein n=1 Tax=Kushneria indalinina DSM 14324 TaxID=1122140 RepID=A0A3D9DXF2_9GAMM|nr:hypothetical protein [Kushneria indalinina]REC95457.1 hypothetical protein C8D72_0106 [Kushneria indalinina DSM 14324]